MTDQRGQTAPTPPPSPADFSGFYGGSANIGALPVMRGPDDMPEPPAPTFMEGAAASFRSAVDDQEIPGDVREMSARSAVIDRLKQFGYTTEQFQSVVASGPHSLASGMGSAPATVTALDDRKLWDAVLREKQRGHLVDLPDSSEEYYRQARNRFGRADQDAQTAARAGLLTQLAGGLPAAFLDPVNVATLPFGGGARTIAGRIVTAGLLNAGVEAVEQPMVAETREKRGKTLTLENAAINVGTAFVAGGAFHGAITEPAGALLKRFLRKVPVEQMTDAERAAVSTLQRGEEADQTSPFTAGAGTEAHVARLDASMQAIAANLPGAATSARANLRGGTSLSSRVVTGEAATVSVDVTSAAARRQFKSRVHSAEATATNDYNAASGAMGPYQFLASTWNNYYIRRYGRGGLSDGQIAAKRRDPQINEVLMDDLTADNARHLRRLGIRETAGNLYLEHFAGQGGAEAIFRAAPDTPIERILSPKAIKNNPFLRGKTAQDVIEWAHRRMGETPGEAPVVRRDQFAEGEAGDAEWQRAQHESDVAEAELARVQGERNYEAGYLAEPGERQAMRAEMAQTESNAPEATLESPPARTAQQDFQSGYLADAGERQAARADMEQPTIDPRAEAVIGEYGTDRSSPGEALPTDSTRQTYAIEMPQRGRPASDLAPASEPARTVYVSSRGSERLSAAQQGPGGATVEVDEAGGAILVQSDRGLEAIPFSEGPSKGMQQIGLRRTSNPRPTQRSAPGQAWSAAIDHGTAARRPDPVAELDADPGVADTASAAFSDPVGPAAREVANGLSHDLNQAIESGELGDIAFAADGIETAHGGAEPRYRTAREVLAELDADDAAIAALRACL